MRIYNYVGPRNLLQLIQKEQVHTQISKVQDILNWIEKTGQKLNKDKEVVATFVIGINHNLLIEDRGIEHVVCANGAPVLAAGEITFV